MLDSKHQLKQEKSATETLNLALEEFKKEQLELKTEIANEKRAKDEGSQKLDICMKQIDDLQIEFKGKLTNERASKESINMELEKYVKRVQELESLSPHGMTDSSDNKEVDVHYSDIELDLETLGHTARSTMSSKNEMTDDGNEQKFKDLKESRNRLKHKTKLLLKQYRNKRSLLEKKDRQLTAQRTGLIRLQTLHQSVESNHYIVIHHLGQQIIQTAKLVATLWPGKSEILQELQREKKDKLSEWILYIDNLSSWTINKLVKVSMGKR